MFRGLYLLVVVNLQSYKALQKTDILFMLVYILYCHTDSVECKLVQMCVVMAHLYILFLWWGGSLHVGVVLCAYTVIGR